MTTFFRDFLETFLYEFLTIFFLEDFFYRFVPKLRGGGESEPPKLPKMYVSFALKNDFFGKKYRKITKNVPIKLWILNIEDSIFRNIVKTIQLLLSG